MSNSYPKKLCKVQVIPNLRETEELMLEGDLPHITQLVGGRRETHVRLCWPSKLQGRQALRFSCPLGGSPPAGPWRIPLDSGTHFPPFPLCSVCIKPLWIISDWIVRRPQTKSTDSLLACLRRRECLTGSSLGNSSGYPWTPSFAARGWLDTPQGGAPGMGWTFCILLYLPLSLCHLLPSGLYSPIRGPSWPSPEHA